MDEEFDSGIDTSDDIDSSDVVEDEPEDISEDMPEDIPEDVPEDEPEEVEDDISEDIPEDVPEDEPGEVEDDISEDIPEDVSEDEAEEEEDIMEYIPEDVPEDETETIEDTAETEEADYAEQTEDAESEDVAEDTAETEETDYAEQAEDAESEDVAEDIAETEEAVADDEDTVPPVVDAAERPSDKENPDDSDAKVLKRDELDLLRSGDEAIKNRLEAQADDYRDKGFSEEEIRDKIAADKWKFQKEFLDDAFPGQDVSPNVFNGLTENGAEDRMKEIDESDSLKEILSPAEKIAEEKDTAVLTENNDRSSVDTADTGAAKIEEYKKTLKDFCESRGFAEHADFSDFDPKVAYDLAKSVVDAKKDFPDLKVNYLGSTDNQVKGIHDTVEKDRYEFYKQNGIDDELAAEIAKSDADYYVESNKLNDTEGTYAWSLETNNPALEKYDGVAVNNKYAGDYDYFKNEKQHDEDIKWAPVGCGSPKAVADHELGHEIDKLLGASEDSRIKDMFAEMIKDNAKEVLSEYAEKNVKEFIAEAYSEYRNNPEPRVTAVSVYNRLIELRDMKK